MDKNSIRPWDANGSLFLWEQKLLYHCVKKNQAVREKITGIPDHHATKGRSEVGKDEMRKRRRCRSVLLFY
jgi:hypothetical protein